MYNRKKTEPRAFRQCKLHQSQNVNRKWSGIKIRMSAGSLQKCYRFIDLSVSVILPSFAKINRWNDKKSPKIPCYAM